MNDILDTILAKKREEVAALRAGDNPAMIRQQAEAAPAPRGFANALRSKAQTHGIGVIAEIKKASPSKGLIRADFDPSSLAKAYAAGGAACLSVLTDREFFQGAPEYLQTARAACDLPALRKDFIIDPLQIDQARALGGDCILLIAAALDDARMQALADKALAMHMDVLVEVHNETELHRVLALDSRCILGINNRDLTTFHTTLDTTLALRRQVPAERLLVSESGIHTRADIQQLRSAGITAFLIGESLMRQPDPQQALATLLS